MRVGICKDPYMLNLCEPHLARLRRVLPEGGAWVIRQYPRGEAQAEGRLLPPSLGRLWGSPGDPAPADDVQHLAVIRLSYDD